MLSLTFEPIINLLETLNPNLEQRMIQIRRHMKIAPKNAKKLMRITVILIELKKDTIDQKVSPQLDPFSAFFAFCEGCQITH